MKLISWNVNGLRACLTHDFAASFAALDADVFSVQETKMQPGQADFAPACIHAGFAMLLWPLSFVLPNALRAANDVKFTMIVSIASMACWRVGFSYIIGVRMGMGAIGVWIAMVVDWVCRVTCFVTRFRSGVWKEKYKA